MKARTIQVCPDRRTYMADGILDIQEALAAAEADLGLGDPVSLEPDPLPEVEPEAEVVEEQAPEVSADDPEDDDAADEEEVIESFDDLAPESEGTTVDPNSPEFWEQEVQVTTVEGTETIKLDELKNGYLRQADYTRKTQDVAQQRETLKDATDFLGAFNSDPIEFARTLAVRAGLLEEGAQPVKSIDAAKILTPEDYEAEIERRVEERVQSDPSVRQAKVASAQAQLDAEFTRIEGEIGRKLGPTARDQIVQEAIRRGTGDIELVATAMLSRLKAAAGDRSAAKRAAPTRPGSTPEVADTQPRDKVPETVEEAFNMALADAQ